MPQKTLADLLAFLRLLAMHYQTAHWQARGPHAYGDHLLFMRLHESADAHVDPLAEKIAGLFEDGVLDLDLQVSRMAEWCEKAVPFSDMVEKSLRMEAIFQTLVKKAYDGIKAKGGMTLGLDDFLMAMASKHEEHAYLLKQRSRA